MPDSPVSSSFTASKRLAPIPSYLPAWQPHLLSGPSGVGKTALTAWLVTNLRDGIPVFGRETQAPPWIGLIATDRERTDTLQWYEVAGFPDIPCYSAVDDYEQFSFFALRSPRVALEVLNRVIDRFDPPPNSLLILDPISWVAGGDMNKYDRVMPAMGALSQLCLRRRVTILGIAHTGKQRADPKDTYLRPQDKILGSMALLGSSGTQMAFEGPEQTGGDYYRFTWNPHHAPAESFWLDRDTRTGLFIPMPTADEEKKAEDHAEVVALTGLLPTSDQPPIPFAQLVEKAETALQVSRSTTHRLLNKALHLGLAEKAGHGKYRRRRPQ